MNPDEKLVQVWNKYFVETQKRIDRVNEMENRIFNTKLNKY